MSTVFVPVDTAMPTRWRIVRRDTYAQAAVIFFAMGLAAIAIYLVSVIWPTPPPHELVLPHYGTSVVPRHHVDTPIGPSWLIVGLLCILPLPKRILTVRSLFRHGREVVGRVEKQYRKRRTVITYTYTFEGTSYHGTYPMSLGTILAFNEAVAVVVDPRRPARSVLKHAFILEEVDAVPRATVARS